MPSGTKHDASPHQMEPLSVGSSEASQGQVVRLVAAARRLDGSVHGRTREAIAGLVREMNCYYSNLIEGAQTLPLDIERALQRKFSTGKATRNLQIIALAHIEAEHDLERDVDRGAAPTDPAFIQETHRRLYQGVPKELMRLEDATTFVPGEIRTREVRVGSHIAPKAASLPAFLARYHEHYGRLPRTPSSVPEVMAAHHRLTWIHPFMDGNGRVARLVTGLMLRRCGVNDQSLWSLSRGLARDSEGYKRRLAEADARRRGDLDGRGNLSLAALRDLSSWMMDRAVDQANFMADMLALPGLRSRVENYFRAGRPEIRFEAAHLVIHAIAFGEMHRGEASRISGLSERVARDLVSQLLEEGFLASDSPRGVLRAGFPVKARGYYFPNLYPAGLDDPGKQPPVRKLARAGRRGG